MNQINGRLYLRHGMKLSKCKKVQKPGVLPQGKCLIEVV